MNSATPQCPTKIRTRAELLGVAADPTRLRILCFMFDRNEGCVSEIAEALDMSVAAISHHLQIMKEHKIFETQRKGTKICYRLVESNFTKLIRDFVCECS
jgi:ArsR family transcriptional regulator